MERKKNLFIFFLVCTVVLIFRLGYLQVFKAKETNYAMLEQRFKFMPLYRERGYILDRNGIPFTTFQQECIIIVKYDEYLKYKFHFDEIKNKVYINKEPLLPIIIRTDLLSAQTIINVLNQNVYTLYVKNVNSDSLTHVIGYVNGYDQTGISGLQASYNDILDKDTIINFAVMQDINGNIINESDPRIITTGKNHRQQDIVLTVDRHIQRIVDEKLQAQSKSGCVIVQDCKTGYILAMSSVPGFNYDYSGDFLNGTDGELVNRATAEYNPGSVFKLVIAAAILESGQAGEYDYVCNGFYRIGGHVVKCSAHPYGSEKPISLSDGLALSCNSYFLNAARKLGYEKIYKKAVELGLTTETGLHLQKINESKGYLPVPDNVQSNIDIANLALGQWVAKVTPLQICNLTSAIANGGMLNTINLVHSAVNNNQKILNYLNKQGHRVLSPGDAKKLAQYLRFCVTAGTGKSANISGKFDIAGKTGTAGGNTDDNTVWFTGFFPAHNPTYTMTVVLEHSKSGAEDAAPLFGIIAEEIMKIN